MKLEQAIEIADKYFSETCGGTTGEIYDTGNSWVMFLEAEEYHRIGSIQAEIIKATGTLREFYLPSRKNFAILKKAERINFER